MMSASQRARTSDSIRSPIYWGVLGLVIERPGYGYGLVQRFVREYGEALPLTSHSHVYKALDVLRAAGLVQAVEERISQGGRQPKPHYRATPQGVRTYAHRLMTQAGAERLRSRLFARQLAALASAPELGLEVIESYEKACLEEARADTTSPVGIGGAPSGGVDSLAVALPAEQARLSSEAELPWVSYARARFTELLSTESTADGAA